MTQPVSSPPHPWSRLTHPVSSPAHPWSRMSRPASSAGHPVSSPVHPWSRLTQPVSSPAQPWSRMSHPWLCLRHPWLRICRNVPFLGRFGDKVAGKADITAKYPKYAKMEGDSIFCSPRGGGGIMVEVMDTLWATEELSSGLGMGIAERSLCHSHQAQPPWDRPQ